jgi:squalene monooxygenase
MVASPTFAARSWRVVRSVSNFVGTMLEDVLLPTPQDGTVALVKGHGPVVLYQIGEHDTWILIEVRNPLPSDPKASNPQLDRSPA